MEKELGHLIFGIYFVLIKGTGSEEAETTLICVNLHFLPEFCPVRCVAF
jgi:hypothetical protein